MAWDDTPYPKDLENIKFVNSLSEKERFPNKNYKIKYKIGDKVETYYGYGRSTWTGWGPKRTGKIISETTTITTTRNKKEYYQECKVKFKNDLNYYTIDADVLKKSKKLNKKKVNTYD